MNKGGSARDEDTAPGRRFAWQIDPVAWATLVARRSEVERAEADAKDSERLARESAARVHTQVADEPAAQPPRATSGLRRSVAHSGKAGSLPGSPDSKPSDAHAEMLRATERGDCVVFSDALEIDGARVQRSAWLLEHGSLLIATWRQNAAGHWSQVQSYAVQLEGVTKLASLTARALDRSSNGSRG